MKKRILAIALCLITILCAMPLTAFADTTNVIADENLLACLIEKGLDKDGNGAISKNELAGLTDLSVYNKGISSLEGLQYATSLLVIDASKNNITDISPIMDLSSIMMIELEDNKLSGELNLADTSWEFIISLGLGNNELTSISGAESIMFIDEVVLSGNRLSDATELLGFTTLTTLYIQNNCYSLSPADGDMAYFDQIRANNPNLDTFVYAPQLVGEITKDFILDITDSKLLKALIANGVDVSGDGKISACELGNVYTALDLSDCGITDISALAYAINTPSIDLSANNITSIEALEGLTQLTELNLSCNSIEDISIVSGFTSLVAADFSRNNIKDASALQSLTALKTLNLSDNFISSVNFSSSFENLDLSYNVIASASELFAIMAEKLDISYNNLVASNISASDFENVATLIYAEQTEYDGSYRDVVEIPDEALLSTLLSYTNINTNNDDVITKGELANYNGTLDLSNKDISDITGLCYMKRLSALLLSNTGVSDLSEVAGMTRLVRLIAANTDVSSIAPVLRLEKLEVLSLPNTKVSNLDELNDNKLYSLNSINLAGNGIVDVSPLGNIPSLTIITLSSNKITDIDFLSSITAPELVYLNDNEIKDIDAIFALTTLRKLDISYNWIDIPADFENVMNTNNKNLVLLNYSNQKKIIMANIEITATSEDGFSLVINGEDLDYQVNYKDNLLAGSIVSVTAFEEEDDFLYWMLSDGKIVSYEKEYTFIVASSMTLKAVFRQSRYTTSNYVSFYTDSDQELSRILYTKNTSADKIELPRSPEKTGHKFVGWSIDGVNAIAEENLKDEIVAALQNGDVAITPVYEKLDILYTITVINGTGGGQYTASSSVTVTANAPEQGKKFAYWVDGSGKILSYKESYLFMVSSDIELTAVYVDADDEVVTAAVITINSIYANYEANTVTFVVARDIPLEYTVVQTGIILTQDGALAEDDEAFVIGAQNIIKGTASSNDNKATYVATKGNVKVGDTWYARGYVVYLDASGELIYLYSITDSFTM